MAVRRVAAFLALALAIPALPPAAALTVPIGDCPLSAEAVGISITDQLGLFSGASWTVYGGLGCPSTDAGGTPASPTGVNTPFLTPSFGLAVIDMAVLSSGAVEFADTPNVSGSTTASYATGFSGGNDVTVLALEVFVRPGADCLEVDFQFLSEEFPEFVGTAFNDAFIAELDVTTWSVDPFGIITAPDNFAFDIAGNPISINAVGPATMTAALADGSTYDGATPRLTARTPITGGIHTVFLSIFDAGDGAYDSAVLLDNMRVFQAPPDDPCFVGTVPPVCPSPPGPGPCPEPDPPVNVAAKAAFSYERGPGCGPQPILFADESLAGTMDDVAGTLVAWEWDFGDGQSSSEQHPQHTYAEEGEYDVTLTVLDSNGDSATDTRAVRVVYTDCPIPHTTPMRGAGVPDEPRDDRDGELAAGDRDGDSVPDGEDGCIDVANRDQADSDGDGAGDACDADLDEDGVPNTFDVCPFVPDAGQLDGDGDRQGDACDLDADGDTVTDAVDNCPGVRNVSQADSDKDGAGDACGGGVVLVGGSAGTDPLVRDGSAVASPATPTPAPPAFLPLGLLAGLLLAAVLVAVLRRRN